MKKFTKIVAVILLALTMLLCTACVEYRRDNQPSKIENEYSICYGFTPTNDTLAITDQTTVKDYMDALKEDGKLAFEGSEGDYGYFITSIMGIGSRFVSSTDNSYTGYDWMLYTTLTSIDGAIYSKDDSTFVCDGIVFYEGSYGVSNTPCIEG